MHRNLIDEVQPRGGDRGAGRGRAWLAVGALVVGAVGCVGFDPPPGSDDGDDEVGADRAHELSGELILFVNSRLTDQSAQFAAHRQLAEPGTYVGNALYLYDPGRECPEGGSACRLVRLGNLRLDETLGEISVRDGSLRKFVVYDLAHHPQVGLWGLSFDAQNDEWGIARLGVPDWGRADQWLTIERWAVRPGAPESPSTDPCYWQEAASALEFIGDRLVLGVRGAGNKGLLRHGSLFEVDLGVIERDGYCVHPGDISQDPHYYACASVCTRVCDFGERLGAAGDVVEALSSGSIHAWVRSEDDLVMPLDRNEMYACALDGGQVAAAQPIGLYQLGVQRGDEIEGLARIDGKLYGLSVLGKVYEIDEAQRTVQQVDDLGPLFPPQGLRLRGATKVVVPERAP